MRQPEHCPKHRQRHSRQQEQQHSQRHSGQQYPATDSRTARLSSHPQRSRSSNSNSSHCSRKWSKSQQQQQQRPLQPVQQQQQHRHSSNMNLKPNNSNTSSRNLIPHSCNRCISCNSSIRASALQRQQQQGKQMCRSWPHSLQAMMLLSASFRRCGSLRRVSIIMLYMGHIAHRASISGRRRPPGPASESLSQLFKFCKRKYFQNRYVNVNF